MKKISLFCIMAILACSVSCSREEDLPFMEDRTPGPETALQHIPTGFSASLPAGRTRTAVDMATGVITWHTDDPVMVSNGSEQMTMYVDEGGSTTSGLYSTEDVFDGSSFFAVYPAEDASYSSGVFNSVIPTAQTYCKGGFSKETFPMVAVCDSRRNFQFRNAASLLKINSSAPAFEGLGILSVAITADEPLSGPVSVNYASPGENPVVDCSGGEKTVSVTSIDGTIPFGEPVYVVVAPGDYNNLRISFTLDNGLEYTYEQEGEISVDRSAYREINVSLVDDYTDLSSGETANCYTITEPGAYKFRADVKGNGVETSCGLPSVTEGVVSARVYYNDGYEFTAGGFGYYGGYIYFRTQNGPLGSGTALVSALDEEGRTLWSWHIWACEEIADVTLSDGSTWLNMNLGAHQIGFNKNGYNGYYYQWGRKDPFLQKYTTSAAANVLSPFVSHASATDGSLEKSIANPHIFYGGYHPSGISDITEDWSTYDDDEKVYDWWNKDITGDGQNSVPAAKTMFDPCPPGYHVPVYSDIQALLALTIADSSSDSNGRTVEGKLFFPYTSYRYITLKTEWWPGGSEASRIFIPSATPYETTTRSHRRISRMYMTSSPSQGITGGARSYGLPVRCIK